MTHVGSSRPVVDPNVLVDMVAHPYVSKKSAKGRGRKLKGRTVVKSPLRRR
jgi:hypothetical protein